MWDSGHWRLTAPRLGVVLLLLAGTGVAACGRREKPAWFDAHPPPPPRVAVSETALPAAALQVQWGNLSIARTVGANSVIPVNVSFTNRSAMPWPDVAAANPRLRDGSYAVRLSYEWIPAADPHEDRRGAKRADLPRSVMPGDSIEMPLSLQAPAEPGRYTLVIELVQELVQWFADVGADRIMLPIRVVPAEEAPAGNTASPPVQPPKAPAPL